MISVSPQYVNKIVKGKENLTLDTISKLEQALEINLFFSGNENQTFTKNYKIEKEYVYFHLYANKEEIAKQKTTYKYSNDYFPQNAVNEKISNYG